MPPEGRLRTFRLLLNAFPKVVLDMAEVTRAEFPGIEIELLDFGVVGPGPRIRFL